MFEKPDPIAQAFTLFHAYSTALHRETAMPSLLQTLVMRAVQLLSPAAAGCFIEWDKGNDAFFARFSHGYAYPKLFEKIAFSDDDSHLIEIMQMSTPEVFRPPSGEPAIAWLPAIAWPLYLEANEKATPLESIAVPVQAPDRTLGVLLVERFHDPAFSPQDTQLLNSFTRQATLAIHKVQLHQENLRIALELEDELKSVGEVQTELLPEIPGVETGYEIFSHYQPAARAGGDYFDFMPLEDGRLAVIVADVTGHGAPAAVIAAMMKVVMRNLLEGDKAPDAVLMEANRQMRQYIKTQFFITTFLGALDPKKRELEYVSAGHEPPIHFCGHSRTIAELRNEKGFPVRLMPDNEFDLKREPYQPGDFFVFYTDGITEMFNEDGHIYSFEDFYEKIKAGPKDSAEALGNSILARLAEYRGKEPLHDDVTLLALKCL